VKTGDKSTDTQRVNIDLLHYIITINVEIANIMATNKRLFIDLLKFEEIGYMKAFLLAAGLGTRLKPITDNVPKCLVSIHGRPLLAWWMDLFEKHHIEEVLINTHYLPIPVQKYIKSYNKLKTGTTLVEFYESKLLGSGGTVLNNRNFIGNDENFLVCYADNLTNANLAKMIAYHMSHEGVLTMGLFHTNNPTGCGIAALDAEGRICEFEEKPQRPTSNLANAGIYVVNKKIFEYIPKKSVVDFGKDVLPLLVNKMCGYIIDEYLLDIGTMENYKKAQREWQE